MRKLLVLLCVGLLLAGCRNRDGEGKSTGGGTPGPGPGPTPPTYDVSITRTTYGIPHVKAANYSSLGYGLGYAFAEDNLCVLMEDLVTIRGERSKYFGPNGSYTLQAAGGTSGNVDSDFFWKFIADAAAVKRQKDAALPEAAAATRGYKDGFNRYIRELKSGGHGGRHQSCRNAPWLAEISEDDMYRRYVRLGVLASSSVFVPGIAQAQPPPLNAPLPAALSRDQIIALGKADPGPLKYFDPDQRFGSNMASIAPAFSETGYPIQFINPHFPWQGTERLWLAHMTIPGTLDIEGVALHGVPAALIGFNDKFAWSHTVSTAYRFTFYELTLVPGDPTRYIVDGAVKSLVATPLEIEVKQDDGSLTTMTRTLYRSEYGPMVGLKVSGVDILPWTPLKAYGLRDANLENDRLINQFFRWNKAQSLAEFKALHKSVLGVPWVNTTATGPGGNAYYGDVTVVPNVTDAKVQQCATSVQAQALAVLSPGLPLLDGSRSACAWGTDADAPAPGIFGPSNLPTLERDDWVGNNNDSYWLTNPAQPLPKFASIIGDFEKPRSLRTRHAITKMLKRADGSDGRSGNQWTQASLEQSVLDSHIYSADLALDDLQSTVCAVGYAPTSNGPPIDVRPACTVLANWDRSNNRDSRGGHLWREFWRGAMRNPGLSGVAGSPVPIPVFGNYLMPFSASDPVNTPNTLNYALPTVQAAFGDAVAKFKSLNIPLDARLGDIQRSGVNGDDIEVFGGEGNLEGAFTIARGPLNDTGYHVNFGNSFVAVVTWDAQGVKADGFVTYSQSTDPASPHYADFTRAYSAKLWKRLPFHPAEIADDTISTLRLTE